MPGRVLLISPHFPPDTSAAAHRMRLVAPHLAAHGWTPTVLAVEPRGYAGRLDPDLAALVPPSLRVERAPAWSPRAARRLGFGDLGLRAFAGLHRAASAILAREPHDLVAITVLPGYPALLGPMLRRRFGVPYVIDYQDPWVSAWGESVGGGAGGAPDLRSRASRWLALRLEPTALGHAAGISAVSAGTWAGILERNPRLRDAPRAEIPLGGEPDDFRRLAEGARANPIFDPRDGDVHLCFVGTLLPRSLATLDALLGALAALRESHPALYARARLHFVGTSNRTDAGAPARVVPAARARGVADRVAEHPARVDYLDALKVLADADAIVLLGSDEPHYTASRLYPALLARRPLLAIYHRASTVSELLARHARPPAARLVTYDDAAPAPSRAAAVRDALAALLADARYRPECFDAELVERYSANAMAARFAALFDAAAEAATAR